MELPLHQLHGMENDFQSCFGIGEDTMKLTKTGIVFAISSLMLMCIAFCPGAMASDVFTVRDGVLIKYNGTDLYGVFADCSSLERVVLPRRVNTSDYLFQNCVSLRSVDFPEGMEKVGYGAFYNCGSLENISFPDGMEVIGDYAFGFCSGLVDVIVPADIDHVGNYAFGACGRLKTVTISNGVKSMGDGVFYGCSGIETVFIPESVTQMGADIFAGCSDVVICGAEGSYAQRYAADNGIPFILSESDSI